MKSRIAIIVPWFGLFPEWMSFFLRSVRANPILSYHFWTDQIPPQQVENLPNVHFNFTTFDEYCERVSNVLEIEFKPAGAYKMCDLRPFYPLIHKEDVKDYEFIGFGDIDLVLGDMQAYIEPILDKLDVFSAHADRISGHFFFMRNDERYRKQGYKIKNWRQLLSVPHNLGIDEGAYCDVICPVKGIQRRIWHRITKNSTFSRAWKISLNMSRISSVVTPRRFHFKELHSTHSTISPNLLSYKWSDTAWIYDGKTIKGKNNGLSYPYLHFLYLKTAKSLPVSPVWKDGFYKVEESEGEILITGREIANI